MHECDGLPDEEIVNMALTLSTDVLKVSIKPYFTRAGLANKTVQS